MGTFAIPLGKGGDNIELQQEFGGFGASWFTYKGRRLRGFIETGVTVEADDGQTYFVRLAQQYGDIYPRIYVNNREVDYVERPPAWLVFLSASLFLAVFVGFSKGIVPVFAPLGAYFAAQVLLRKIKNRMLAQVGVPVVVAMGWLLPLMW